MPPSRALQVVVFDIDDTLYPEREFVRSGYAAVARRLRQRLGRDEPFEDWLWARFEQGEYAGAFDALNAHFDLGLTHEDVVDCVEGYRLHPSPEISPYPGMAAVLDRIARGCRLAVISDGPSQVQRQKLAATGLADRFELVLVSGDFEPPAGKPDARMYQHVAERLDVPHAACAYVGDNLSKDFVAPNALGWLSVYYQREGQVHAHKPAPSGGEPQVAVASDEALLASLGLGAS